MPGGLAELWECSLREFRISTTQHQAYAMTVTITSGHGPSLLARNELINGSRRLQTFTLQLHSIRIPIILSFDSKLELPPPPPSTTSLRALQLHSTSTLQNLSHLNTQTSPCLPVPHSNSAVWKPLDSSTSMPSNSAARKSRPSSRLVSGVLLSQSSLPQGQPWTRSSNWCKRR